MKQIDEEQVRDWELVAAFILILGFIISRI